MKSSRMAEPKVTNPLGSLRLLYVDDNAISRELVVEMLRDKGITIETAKDGQEAVNKVFLLAYDIVIMDIEMPIMNGYEATKRIRGDKRFQELPIIALTAHDRDIVEEEIFKVGMNDVLQKPIEFDRLLENINNWIKKDYLIELIKSEPINISGAYPETVPGVDTTAGIRRLKGKAPLYFKLLVEFSENNRSFGEEIRKLLLKNDISSAAKEIHKLKGISGNLSITSVYSAVIGIENRIKSHMENERIRHSAYAVALSVVMKAVDRLEEALEDLYRNIAALNLGDLNENECAATDYKPELSDMLAYIDELLPLLDENNLNSEAIFERLKPGLAAYGYKGECCGISAFMDSFDYQKAHCLLKSIKAKLSAAK